MATKYYAVTIQCGEEVMEKMRDAILPASVKYCIFGYEISPTTKKDHLQSFIIFKKRQRLSGVHNALERIYKSCNKKLSEEELDMIQNKFRKAHAERMFSEAGKNIAYCKKDGKFLELGTYTPPGDGEYDEKIPRRERIENMYNDMMVNGVTRVEAINADPDLISYAYRS